MAQPFVIFLGQREPVITYALTVKGVAYPLTSCTVAFSLRPVGSATLTLDHKAALISGDPLLGICEYDWGIGDTATAGDYVGWFTVTLPNGLPQDTPEFEVVIASHATAGTAALISMEEAIDAMRIGNTIRPIQDNDHQLLRSLILSASQVCEEFTAHRFTLESAVAKNFTYDGEVMLNLAPFDLRAASQVQIDTDVVPLALDPTQYRFEPRNLPFGVYTHIVLAPYNWGGSGNRRLNWWGGGGFPGTFAQFGRQVTITGDWGWTTVPEPIRQGVKVLVGRWFNNPLGLQILRQGQSELQFTRGGSGSGGKGGIGDDLPEEVTSLWKPFVRPGAA